MDDHVQVPPWIGASRSSAAQAGCSQHAGEPWLRDAPVNTDSCFHLALKRARHLARRSSRSICESSSPNSPGVRPGQGIESYAGWVSCTISSLPLSRRTLRCSLLSFILALCVVFATASAQLDGIDLGPHQPELTRSTIMDRSNSAKTTHSWNMARAVGGRGVDRLLMQIQITIQGLQFVQQADQVL